MKPLFRTIRFTATDKGIVLITSILVMAALAALMTPLLKGVHNTEFSTTSMLDDGKALNYAKAGLDLAYSKLIQDSENETQATRSDAYNDVWRSDFSGGLDMTGVIRGNGDNGSARWFNIILDNTGNMNITTNTGGGALIGRFAVTVEDECSKINLNSAGGWDRAAYWDSPIGWSPYEINMGTTLSSVFYAEDYAKGVSLAAAVQTAIRRAADGSDTVPGTAADDDADDKKYPAGWNEVPQTIGFLVGGSLGQFMQGPNTGSVNEPDELFPNIFDPANPAYIWNRPNFGVAVAPDSLTGTPENIIRLIEQQSPPPAGVDLNPVTAEMNKLDAYFTAQSKDYNIVPQTIQNSAAAPERTKAAPNAQLGYNASTVRTNIGFYNWLDSGKEFTKETMYKASINIQDYTDDNTYPTIQVIEDSWDDTSVTPPVQIKYTAGFIGIDGPKVNEVFPIGTQTSYTASKINEKIFDGDSKGIFQGTFFYLTSYSESKKTSGLDTAATEASNTWYNADVNNILRTSLNNVSALPTTPPQGAILRIPWNSGRFPGINLKFKYRPDPSKDLNAGDIPETYIFTDAAKTQVKAPQSVWGSNAKDPADPTKWITNSYTWINSNSDYQMESYKYTIPKAGYANGIMSLNEAATSAVASKTIEGGITYNNWTPKYNEKYFNTGRIKADLFTIQIQVITGDPDSSVPKEQLETNSPEAPDNDKIDTPIKIQLHTSAYWNAAYPADYAKPQGTATFKRVDVEGPDDDTLAPADYPNAWITPTDTGKRGTRINSGGNPNMEADATLPSWIRGPYIDIGLHTTMNNGGYVADPSKESRNPDVDCIYAKAMSIPGTGKFIEFFNAGSKEIVIQGTGYEPMMKSFEPVGAALSIGDKSYLALGCDVSVLRDLTKKKLSFITPERKLGAAQADNHGTATGRPGAFYGNDASMIGQLGSICIVDCLYADGIDPRTALYATDLLVDDEGVFTVLDPSTEPSAGLDESTAPNYRSFLQEWNPSQAYPITDRDKKGADNTEKLQSSLGSYPIILRQNIVTDKNPKKEGGFLNTFDIGLVPLFFDDTGKAVLNNNDNKILAIMPDSGAMGRDYWHHPKKDTYSFRMSGWGQGATGFEAGKSYQRLSASDDYSGWTCGAPTAMNRSSDELLPQYVIKNDPLQAIGEIAKIPDAGEYIDGVSPVGGRPDFNAAYGDVLRRDLGGKNYTYYSKLTNIIDAFANEWDFAWNPQRVKPYVFGKININTAPVEVLRALPFKRTYDKALYDAIAQAIVNARQGIGVHSTNAGPFRSIGELWTRVVADIKSADNPNTKRAIFTQDNKNRNDIEDFIRISNLVTVKSDVYRVIVRGQAVHDANNDGAFNGNDRVLAVKQIEAIVDRGQLRYLLTPVTDSQRARAREIKLLNFKIVEDPQALSRGE